MTPAPHALSFILSLLSTLACAAAAAAQQPAPAPPTVTVTLTAGGVRLVALGAVVRTRLEVYDAAGAVVFDSGLLSGNVCDLSPRAAGLADGAYTLVLTSREASGQLSLKQAGVVLAGGEVSLALGRAEAAGEAERGAAGSAAVDAGAVTLSTHDGRDGALTSTAGALTLRTGDVLSGAEREHVRVTPEGLVGVGTDKPEATLDVAGAVRARGGLEFSDGSTLDAMAGRLKLRDASGQEVPAQGLTAAQATANRLAKFADAAGTLTDSGVTEANGNVGVGTAAPASPLTVFSTTNVSPFAVEGAHPIVIGFAVENAAPGSKRWAFQVAGPQHPQGVAAGSFIFRQGTDDLNPLVVAPTGNVGVGTVSPAARLHVAGNVNFTGLRTEATTVNSAAAPPNVIGGFHGTGAGGATPGNRVTAGVVGATIGGGGFNGDLITPSAGGDLTGDNTNRVTDWFGTVSGGLSNRAGNDDPTLDNAPYATVGGGDSNTASGVMTTVGGGRNNTASGFFATVGGGIGNTASNDGATVGGGNGNVASGDYATVAGGQSNAAAGDHSFAAGWQAKALHRGAFVWADSPGFTTGVNFTSTNDNQFLIRAAGGVGINTNSPQAPLHLVGSARVEGDLTVTGNISGTLPAGSANYIQNTTTAQSANFNINGSGTVGGSLTVDTDTLFVDAANNRVGVGTATPRSPLHVRRDDSGDVLTLLTLMNGGGFVGAGAAIDFVTFDSSLTPPPSARIIATDANNFGSHLTFWTRPSDGNAATAPSERMRISQTGNVGIGTTDPQRALHVSDTMRLQPRATPPANPASGDIYFDTSEALCVYVSAAWAKVAGPGTCN